MNERCVYPRRPRILIGIWAGGTIIRVVGRTTIHVNVRTWTGGAVARRPESHIARSKVCQRVQRVGERKARWAVISFPNGPAFSRIQEAPLKKSCKLNQLLPEAISLEKEEKIQKHRNLVHFTTRQTPSHQRAATG